ncbi:MAG: aa3-type cytochrome c oxidase subunit IV [Rhodospirillaceae bacterium]|nr:aa3-type cytochrome c oxidase subunit IV [Rhodospirillaceae bacterium]
MMTEENLDYEEKEDTWSLFVKLTQWSSVLVIALLILLAFFLL